MLVMSALLHVLHTFLCAALLLVLTFPRQGMRNYNRILDLALQQRIRLSDRAQKSPLVMLPATYSAGLHEMAYS